MTLDLESPPRSASTADLLALAESERFHEIIDGRLVRKAAPSSLHVHRWTEAG